MNILVIEPSEILAKIYQQAFKDSGHSVQIASGAQEAISALDGNQAAFDVIFLELQLAGHFGVEFLYELRSYNEWQNIPVVVLSMIPEAELSQQLKKLSELGIIKYLYKPTTSLQKLTSLVSDLELSRL